MKRTDVYTQPTSHAATELVDTEIEVPIQLQTIECSFDLVDELHLSCPHHMPWDGVPKSEHDLKMEQSDLEQFEVIESDI